MQDLSKEPKPTGYIREGQFKDNEFSGFGRRLCSNGYYEMGWYENDALHGYGKVKYASGKTKEGLLENWSFKKGDPDKSVFTEDQ